MKIKICSLLYLFLSVLTFNKTCAQEIIVEPIAIHATSETFLEFGPGFRVKKGRVMSAHIDTLEACDLEMILEKVSNSDSNSDTQNLVHIDIEKAKDSTFSIYQRQVKITLLLKWIFMQILI